MSEDRNCSTCCFWRCGAVALTDRPVDTDAGDVGACELYPPMIEILNGAPVSVQPTTHGTRRCNEWKPSTWFDYPEDDDDGDGEPGPFSPSPPDIDKVRRLFPNTPLKPAAA